MQAANVRSTLSTVPPASFQAVRPPFMFSTGFSPMRWSAWVASSERQPLAQWMMKVLSSAKMGLW